MSLALNLQIRDYEVSAFQTSIGSICRC